jgi:hypothetical protein
MHVPGQPGLFITDPETLEDICKRGIQAAANDQFVEACGIKTDPDLVGSNFGGEQCMDGISD